MKTYTSSSSNQTSSLSSNSSRKLSSFLFIYRTKMGSTDGSPYTIVRWENEEKMDETRNSEAVGKEKFLIQLLIAREKVRCKTMQAIITASWLSFFCCRIQHCFSLLLALHYCFITFWNVTNCLTI